MNMWSNFWEIFSGLFGVFVFIAYLVVLFTIVLDLFRDPKLAGWAKAVWLIFLVFVPFLTALVYVIARGRGLAERERARHRIEQEYIDDRGNVSQASVTPEVAKAQALGGDPSIGRSAYDSVQNDSMIQS